MTKYLYAEPVVTADNIALLAHSIVQGDRKWSDINLHPHSYPGRWLTVLDLSHLGGGGSYLGADALTISGALGALLELTPALTHLRLPPSGSGVQLADLRLAPCIRRLRALEGVHLTGRKSEEDAVRLLRAARSLELLGLVWVSSTPLDDDLSPDDLPPPPILAALHTLTLVGGEPGPLLAALTRAELPALTRLVMSPYDPGLRAWEDDEIRGGPRALQFAHGHKIRSLTYVATPGWPHRDTLPGTDTLALHPSLAHLHLALPHALLHDNPDLARSLADPYHPLSAITLPRWPRAVRPDSSVSPGPAQTGPVVESQWPAGNRFLAALLSRPSRLRTVRIDGFTWVSPSLGRWAAESGDSGMMRQWAVAMARAHIELRDMDGASPPIIERGRPSVSMGMGMGMGRKSVDGGRRSMDHGTNASIAIRQSIDQGRRPSYRRRGTGDDSDGG